MAIIRHPYDYMMSRFAYLKRAEPEAPRHQSFAHFMRSFNPDLDQRQWGDRIAMYHEFVDHYYLFEHGVDSFLQHVGLPPKDIINVGALDMNKWRIPVEKMPQEWKDLIDERFAADIALYNEVASKPPHQFEPWHAMET